MAETLLERLQTWIDGVRKVQDESIPLNGNSLIAFLGECKSRIEELERQLATASAFQNAVIDELIVCHIYTKEHDVNARKALHDAIDWNVRVALDPNVSSDAAALIASQRPTEKELADWLLATMNLFSVELASQHKVVGLFLEAIKQEWKELDAIDTAVFRGL